MSAEVRTMWRSLQRLERDVSAHGAAKLAGANQPLKLEQPMIDVHPPEHGIHGARDFFLHLLTITVGLLIAIGLEQSVEALHHRHQRKEAETNIREELQANRELLKTAGPVRAQEVKSLVASAKYLDAKIAGENPSAHTLLASFSEAPGRDAAWRTASSTGVLDYMDYKTVEAFSECYKEQAEYERMEHEAAGEYLQIDALLATKPAAALKTEDYVAAAAIVRRAIADQVGLKAIAVGTMQDYDDALGKQ
jgi:hypothetical protein